MLERALPHLDRAELQTRMRLVVGVVTMLFATAPDPGEPGPLGTDDLDEQLAELVAFLAPGLAASAAATYRQPTPTGGTDVPA